MVHSLKATAWLFESRREMEAFADDWFFGVDLSIYEQAEINLEQARKVEFNTEQVSKPFFAIEEWRGFDFAPKPFRIIYFEVFEEQGRIEKMREEYRAGIFGEGKY